MAAISEDEYAKFLQLHKPQLDNIGIPESLWPSVFAKLKSELFDAGEYFIFVEDENESEKLFSFKVILKENVSEMKAHSNVFLVDHCWTYTVEKAREQLQTIPGLLERMLQLMNLEEEEQAPVDPAVNIELDDQEIEQLAPLKLGENSTKPVQTLSLWSNKLSSLDDVVKGLAGLEGSLKGLWLNENPVTADPAYHDTLLKMLPSLEILDRQFTPRYTEWALLQITGKQRPQDIIRLDLSGRNLQRLDEAVFSRLSNVSFLDISDNPALDFAESLNVIKKTLPALRFLSMDLPDEVPEQPQSSEQQMTLQHSAREYVFAQLPYLEGLNGTTADETEIDVERMLNVDKVLREMWRHNQHYQISTDEEGSPTWYIMDEVGSRFSHSDEPNFRFAPFLFINTGVFFTLVWPVKDIHQGEFCTRDFLAGVTDETQRLIRKSVWFRNNMISSDFSSRVDQLCESARAQHASKLAAIAAEYAKKKLEEQELGSQKLAEQVPADNAAAMNEALAARKAKPQLAVYTNVPLVEKFLTSKRFRIVETMDEADILWTTENISEDAFASLTQFTNQFPGEASVVTKNLLAETIARYYGNAVKWFPETYNLDTQTKEFIGEFKRRDTAAVDNHWILKPAAKGRGIGISVTDNLQQIIRCSEAAFTRHIVSKYVHKPALYNGRKFDLRFIVLLTSVQPLQLYMYTESFWIRFANVPFSLAKLDQYEKHFTVMNYSAFKLTQVHHPEFVREFERQYPHASWAAIQEKIYAVIKEVFVAASAAPPPGAQSTDGVTPVVTLKHCPASRACYGIDIMLDADLEPVLLEVNYNPDCERACKYHPEFFNEVFEFMFTPEDPITTTATTTTKGEDYINRKIVKLM